MARYVACLASEVPPGRRKIVELAGRSLGIFNVGGRLYALRNRCPHQGGPLCEGTLTGWLTSPAPGSYHYERRGEILRCPWHGWEFDLRTGQSWFDPRRSRVRSYPVQLEPGPYVAETYPAAVNSEGSEAMVVVEIGTAGDQAG